MIFRFLFLDFKGQLFKQSLIYTAVNRISLDLQISSLVGYFKKTNDFIVYAICFHETTHDK